MLAIEFDELSISDLFLDALYRSGTAGNAGDDPIHKLLGVANMGGFRSRLTFERNDYAFIAIYSDNSDPDWPDYIDLVNGILTYYGDNKKPGRQLENTRAGGNKILSAVFELAHGGYDARMRVPPFFVFTKGERGRDVIFRGIAVPGANSVSQTEDLVAVWKLKDGQRFQNYRAIFTLLDTDRIKREWLEDLMSLKPLSNNCPDMWRLWVETGHYTPLKASESRQYRTKQEQLPYNNQEATLLRIVFDYFQSNPYLFERFAGEIVKLMDRNVIRVDNTQPSRDGGRDGIGQYRIGVEGEGIQIDFAIEAKCYNENNSVGVRELSRLISRLRHRQFGILVTTSYVAQQAYQEIREDQHPIIVISGRNIVQLLMTNGLGNQHDLANWLRVAFPIN
ncbi:MAG: restriction endonuclease [Anaerolineae bacterium]|nr:restriction endonuclease [Anaerolineae bacterium]